MKLSSPIQSCKELGSDRLNKKVGGGGRRISRKHQGLVVEYPEDDLSEDSTVLETVVVEKRIKRVSKESSSFPKQLPRRRDGTGKEEANGSRPGRNIREGRRQTRPDENSRLEFNRRSRSADASKTAFAEQDRFLAVNQDSSTSLSMPGQPMRQESERGRPRRSTSVDAARYRKASNSNVADEGLTPRSTLQSPRRSGSLHDMSARERRRMDQEASRRSRSASRDRSMRRDMMGPNHEPRRRRKSQSSSSQELDDAISIQTPKGRNQSRSRSGERVRRRLSGDASLYTQGTASSAETGVSSRRMPKGSGHGSAMLSPSPSRKTPVSTIMSPNPTVMLQRRPQSSTERQKSQRRISDGGVDAIRTPPLAGNRRTAILLEYQSKSQGDVVSATKSMSHDLRKIISDRHLESNNPQFAATDSPAVRRRKERRASLTSSEVPSVSSAPIVRGGDKDKPISWKALVDAKTKSNGDSQKKQCSKQQSMKSFTVHDGEAHHGGWDEWGWPKNLGATAEDIPRSIDVCRDASSRKLAPTSALFPSNCSHLSKPRRSSTSAMKFDLAAWDSDSD